MSKVLTFLAAALMLCCMAQAQTQLIVLPQNMALSGSDKDLYLVNHSGKTIIATFVSMTHQSGKRDEWSGYHPATIPDSKSLRITRDEKLYRPGYSDSPVTEIKLWAAVFADGELVGVDPYAGQNSVASFQFEIEKKFQAIATTGRLAAAGDWLELQRRAGSVVPDGDFWGDYSKQRAMQLIKARNGSGGEPAAQNLASEFQKLPEHLWRKK